MNRIFSSLSINRENFQESPDAIEKSILVQQKSSFQKSKFRIRWRKYQSIGEYLIFERETRIFFFSFHVKNRRKMEISVSAISFICHLFGDQFSAYIIIAKKRKTTRVASNYNNVMVIFSNRKKMIPCNQRCNNVGILNSNVYRYLNNIIYKHFTLKLFSIVSFDKSILLRDNLLINWRQQQVVDFSFDRATFVSKQSFELTNIRFVKVHRINPLHFRMFHKTFWFTNLIIKSRIYNESCVFCTNKKRSDILSIVHIEFFIARLHFNIVALKTTCFFF